MCGINFILDRNGNIPAHLINKMNETIHHRGPDHSGSISLLHNNVKLFFGANRLRIIDQDPLSDQPMVSEDNKRVLIFSGEVYNYCEIRNRLTKLGKSFRTLSDTEVLFHQLSEFGQTGIKDLKGMFAFIYYNSENDQLIAARDCHGMKPLFYSEFNGNLIFSSETRGILATGVVDNKISSQQVSEYVKYGYVNHPDSLYCDILQLKPGYCLTYDFKSGKTFTNAFTLNEVSPIHSVETPEVSEIQNMILASLTRQLSSSKPIGLMLSGGIDSSLLLAMAQRHQLPLSHTYSIVNDKSDKSFGTSDYKYSRWLVQHLRWKNHHEITADRELLHRLPEFVSELDQPIGDPAVILTSHLSRTAVKDVGVLLSGAGADEYFAGYNRHSAFWYYLKYYRFFNALYSVNKSVSNLFYSGGGHPLRKNFRLFKKFIKDITPVPAFTYDNFMSKGKKLLNQESQINWPDFTRIDFVEKNLVLAISRDREEYLVNDILLMNDQLSLFHGIEIRSPYLDDDLINYVQKIPPVILLKHDRKWILKKLLSEYGLARIANRSKEGFGFPFGKWIREKQFKYLSENLIDKGNSLFSFIDYNRTVNLINSHMNHYEDYSAAIFSLMVLSEWLKRA